ASIRSKSAPLDSNSRRSLASSRYPSSDMLQLSNVYGVVAAAAAGPPAARRAWWSEVRAVIAASPLRLAAGRGRWQVEGQVQGVARTPHLGHQIAQVRLG